MNDSFRRSDFSRATGAERAAVWFTVSGPQHIAREKAPGLPARTWRLAATKWVIHSANWY